MIAAIALALVQDRAPSEADYYVLSRLPEPAGAKLEVGGLALLPDGRPIACTRRGEIWIAGEAYDADSTNPSGGARAEWTLFAEGLSEPLGLLVRPEDRGPVWIFTVQRGELSRLADLDGDDRADVLETLCDDWRVSGNYHEYAFGPALAPDGSLWITLNVPFGEQPFGHQPWRGHAVRLAEGPRGPHGPGDRWSFEPIACGLRSPAGLGFSPQGVLFYDDNQGEWNGASKLCQVEPGDCFGHPSGMDSWRDPRWRFGEVEELPAPTLMPELARDHPRFRLPAVWFPYDKVGRSPAGFVWDTTGGRFGPFAGQLFVGDQYSAEILRVQLEEVGGRWQGTVFPFRAELGCGVVRVCWDAEGALLIGETSRGWGSLGIHESGVERLSWTGRVPFEVLAVHARPDGYRLVFTEPVRPESAVDPASYGIESYTYEYHSDYGSAEMDRMTLAVESASVAPDGRSADLVIPGLREGYVHEFHLSGIRSRQGLSLLHDRAYATLLARPPR